MLLGLLGSILPVLPGLIFFGLGVLVLGPYDPTLRRIALGIRLALRRWSCLRHPTLRRLGWTARLRHRTVRLAVRAQVMRFRRGEYRFYHYLTWLALFMLSMIAYAGVVFAIRFGMNQFL